MLSQQIRDAAGHHADESAGLKRRDVCRSSQRHSEPEPRRLHTWSCKCTSSAVNQSHDLTFCTMWRDAFPLREKAKMMAFEAEEQWWYFKLKSDVYVNHINYSPAPTHLSRVPLVLQFSWKLWVDCESLSRAGDISAMPLFTSTSLTTQTKVRREKKQQERAEWRTKALQSPLLHSLSVRNTEPFSPCSPK